MRILLDTNVLASSLATRGLCNELLEIVLNEHELLICDAIYDELHRILPTKFKIPQPVIDGFCALLNSQAEFVAVSKQYNLSFSDPDDIPILACAIAGKAGILATGDKALLELGNIRKIPILSPRECWQKLV